MSKIRWACPECGATPDNHGKGGEERCDGRRTSAGCGGFVCECDADTDSGHGDSADDPCHNATCYHCGWGGTFPPPPFNPKSLKGWAKQAWAAGWKPPAGWTP